MNGAIDVARVQGIDTSVPNIFLFLWARNQGPDSVIRIVFLCLFLRRRASTKRIHGTEPLFPFRTILSFHSEYALTLSFIQTDTTNKSTVNPSPGGKGVASLPI